MKLWKVLAVLGLMSVSFTAGAIFGGEVVYIVEDSPTTNNGWTDVLQEVNHEVNASVPHQGEQTGDRLVCSTDYAFRRGTQ